MRKLFFIVCCILALDICLAEDWWKENFIIGAQWGPSLHYKNDNPDSPLVRNFTLLKDGGFNFILGQMHIHNNHADSVLNSNIESLIQECVDSGILFLNLPKDSDITHTYGVDIRDEPPFQDTALWLGKVRNLKQTDPDKLGFINLSPSYGFSSFNAWKSYADAYLGDTTLQVACFDNYFPNSNFNTHRPDPGANYYANLAYVKHLAGSRPLWAYLRCSEKYVEERDSVWQDAYIRIGAFAPLAFGAKGILYFCYDGQDRNKIWRSPGRAGWNRHDMYFNSDESSRQIFFGNIKRDSTSLYPDLAVHTNDSIGTWRYKETSNSGIDNDQKLLTIGTWFGDHIYNMPNLYNWDFTSDGYDKFTTITRQGRLILSKYRMNGWTHYCEISNFPTAYWSTMSRHTCPFGDFNGNKLVDLCLGWTENGQGKLWVLMDCHLDPSHTPTPRGNPMLFDDTSQNFTFSSPIKQIFTRHDSIIAITSDPSTRYQKTSDSTTILLSDTIYTIKLENNHFSCTDTASIVLTKKIDHYWMEETLCGQSEDGDVWEEDIEQAFHLTCKNDDYSNGSIYVWGQYNTRSHQYDRYARIADRATPQSYALLNRKGNPNRIYYTAQATNKFINDSISPVIMNNNNEWIGAYFSSKPNQTETKSLKIINRYERGDTVPNPIPLINDEHTLTNHVLFGLYKERYGDNLYLLIINMKETTNDVIFSVNKTFNNDSILCNTIARMFHTENSYMEYYANRTKIILNNMHGGECALLRLTAY